MEEKEGGIEYYLFGALKTYFYAREYITVHYNCIQYLRESCCKCIRYV